MEIGSHRLLRKLTKYTFKNYEKNNFYYNNFKPFYFCYGL